jgi:hypothetical protein
MSPSGDILHPLCDKETSPLVKAWTLSLVWPKWIINIKSMNYRQNPLWLDHDLMIDGLRDKCGFKKILIKS